MKKKISLFIMLYFYSFLCFAQFFDINQIYISLLDNESFDWEYNNSTKLFSVFKTSSTNRTLYAEFDWLEWGCWEVSGDRRKIIFWERILNDINSLPNIYILDGNTGKINYLGQLNIGYTSSTFKYMLSLDPCSEPKKKFIVYNLESGNIEKELSWNLKSEKYFSSEENCCYILRSNYSDYDFHIYIVSMNGGIFSEGYLNIERGEIMTVIDDEETMEIFDINNFTQFELCK